jgi:hypothetical protein
MTTHKLPAIPSFPHGVTVSPDPYATPSPDWSDLIAYRANGSREVATLTVYPDGRVSAHRSHRARGSLDMAAWAGIIRTLGRPESDYYRGVSLAPNPAETPFQGWSTPGVAL